MSSTITSCQRVGQLGTKLKRVELKKKQQQLNHANMNQRPGVGKDLVGWS